jgi:hypothetical protein
VKWYVPTSMLSMAEIAWIGHGLTSSDLGLETGVKRP